MVAQTRQEWNEHIQQEINFTPQDLDANRQGQYSDRQRTKLESYVKRAQGINPGCSRLNMLVLLLIFFGGLVILNNLMNDTLLKLVRDPTIGPIVGLVVLILVIYALVMGRNTRRIYQSVNHMDKLPLEYAEGVVQVRDFRNVTRTHSIPLIPKDIPWYRRQKRRSARVTLAGQDFILNRDIGLSFLEGATYRLYYVKFTIVTFLLSAELVARPVL